MRSKRRGSFALTELWDWRSRAVWQRNAFVYLKNWRTAFVPPAFEPVIFFFAFGLGLAGYVGTLSYHGVALSYPAYVAPGLLSYAVFGTAFYESLYSAYVRMFYQKTWDGILATQVELSHIVWGEVLWAASRGAMNAAVVSVVLCVFDLAGWLDLHLIWLLGAPVLAFVAGWTFGAFGLIFTAVVPSIDHMNYPVFLIGIPVSLMSNTYFPVEPSHPVLAAVVSANPVYHLSETFRSALVLGSPNEHMLWFLGVNTAFFIVCAVLSQRLMKRRMLGG